MKKYIHWVIFLFGIIIQLLFFDSWAEFVGFSIFLFIMTWNIYAFLNNKNMISFPGMADNIKAGENEDSRIIVFTGSCFITIILFIGWIYQGINR